MIAQTMDVEPASGGTAAAAGTWGEHATRYAGQERFEARAIAAALRLADPGPEDRVVDVATGTGLLLRALAARDPRRRPQRSSSADPTVGAGPDLAPRPLSRPRFDTTKGIRKLAALRTHVSVDASPPSITAPWLTAVSKRPTTNAIRVVRRRCVGRWQ